MEDEYEPTQQRDLLLFRKMVLDPLFMAALWLRCTVEKQRMKT